MLVSFGSGHIHAGLLDGHRVTYTFADIRFPRHIGMTVMLANTGRRRMLMGMKGSACPFGE
jgi:hypothetical protein